MFASSTAADEEALALPDASWFAGRDASIDTNANT
jgi:hypothetical protein